MTDRDQAFADVLGQADRVVAAAGHRGEDREWQPLSPPMPAFACLSLPSFCSWLPLRFLNHLVGLDRPAVVRRMLTACTTALQQFENGVPIDQTRCDELVFAHEFIRLVRHIECAGPKDYALGAD